jgi:rhamnulose-1-phosphate aldolase
MNKGLFQVKEVKKILNEISEVAQYLWERGWAERNAGNISVNITDLLPEKTFRILSELPFLPLNKEYPGLRNTGFLMTGTGTRMRDLARNPLENVCIILIGGNGDIFHVASWNEEANEIRPTSELATHLAIHQMLILGHASERIVLHSHVNELIALTQIPGMNSSDIINRILWGMHPETLIFVPKGAGFVPYRMPGTEHIAQATLKELEHHEVVIWEKHGCLAIGENILDTFDTIDLLAKSARIYFYCRAAGIEPEGLSDTQLSDLRQNYLKEG